MRKKQKAFAEDMRYIAKKASKQPKAKKSKLTRTQQLKKRAGTTRKDYNMNMPGNKKYTENNKGILSFFSKENAPRLCTSIFSIVTPTQKSWSSVSEPIENSMQEFDTSVMSEKIVEASVPTNGSV